MSVTDSGIGISVEGQKNLFKIFGKLNNSLHMNQQGVGLGLMISKKICEHLGGDMTVQSNEGHGSTFTFHIALGGVKKN